MECLDRQFLSMKLATMNPELDADQAAAAMLAPPPAAFACSYAAAAAAADPSSAAHPAQLVDWYADAFLPAGWAAQQGDLHSAAAFDACHDHGHGLHAPPSPPARHGK